MKPGFKRPGFKPGVHRQHRGKTIMKISLFKKPVFYLPAVTLAAVFITAAGFFLYNTRDRHPDHRLDLNIRSSPGPLSVGFSALPITPEIPEPWTDENGNGKFDKGTDTWEDTDGDGEFDGLWLAGFSAGRPAAGVHDDLWARTMVMDNGSCRVSVTVLDAIGLFHDDVIDVRNMVSESAKTTYSIIASTHVHEAPDLLGLWGKNHFSSGVDPAYKNFVKKQAAESIIQACEILQPAVLNIFEDESSTASLVRDSRLPIVKDTALRLLQAVNRETGEHLGLLMLWADHPETLWADNMQITSDFPHFFREGMEDGIRLEGELLEKGLGGTAIYVNGSIGGLLTTDRSVAVEHPFSGESFSEPSFEKAEAQGAQLALAALTALKREPETTLKDAGITIQASTLELPLNNPLFILGSGLGILDRGHSSWMRLRTEISILTIGPLSFLCFPGEVYPELVYGGITTPAGRDYPIAPVETPALIGELPGRHKFIIGLANDEIGYIIPKSEWDNEAPFLYGMEDSPYGETNSPGPETGPLIHAKAMELINQLTIDFPLEHLAPVTPD